MSTTGLQSREAGTRTFPAQSLPAHYHVTMAIARLSGGPLDGQIIPLEPGASDSLIMPYGGGQLVYRREGAAANTGAHDGPTETRFVYAEATEDINPDPDGRDE